ncbi:hypothetical protein AnigIFM50267_005155, partial [Aspergillus niger]
MTEPFGYMIILHRKGIAGFLNRDQEFADTYHSPLYLYRLSAQPSAELHLWFEQLYAPTALTSQRSEPSAGS